MSLLDSSPRPALLIVAVALTGGCSDALGHSTIPPPVGSEELASNLPAGMTLHTDNPFTSTTYVDPVTGVQWRYATNRQGETPTIEIDSTAPSGNGRVFRQSYAGVEDGREPQFPATSLGNGNEVFIAMHVKFDALWENPQNSGIKWHLFNAIQGETGSRAAGWFRIMRESESNTHLSRIFGGLSTERACLAGVAASIRAPGRYAPNFSRSPSPPGD